MYRHKIGVVVLLLAVFGCETTQHRAAERFGFSMCGTDSHPVLESPEVDLVFIATRHDSHARLAIEALRMGKAVWLEKPAALSIEELDDLAIAGVLGAQLACMPRLLADPRGRAPWYNGTGVSLYVLGMMIAAMALRGGAGLP